MADINNRSNSGNKKFRFKVLLLANQLNFALAQKRAGGMAQFCDIIALNICADPNLKDKTYNAEYFVDNNIPVVKVRYKASETKIFALAKISDFFRYLKGSYLGLNLAKEKFGRPDIIYADRAFLSGVLGFALNKAENLTYVVEEYCAAGKSYAEEFEKLSFFRKFLTKLALKNAGAVILRSEKTEGDFKQCEIAGNKFIAISENDPEAGKMIYGLFESVPVKWRVGMSEWVEIDPKWQVLDIGSGHCPARRANVLLEKEIDESVHRSGAKAAAPSDKKLVVGDATAMPFKDKEFDYALASHIAEHIEEADKFISETERVAKRGYIECPGPLSNLILTEPFHLWDISIDGDTLVFKKLERKEPFLPFFYAFFYLNESRVNRKTFHSDNPLVRFFRLALTKIWKYVPYAYTKYHWEGKIKYKIS